MRSDGGAWIVFEEGDVGDTVLDVFRAENEAQERLARAATAFPDGEVVSAFFPYGYSFDSGASRYRSADE